MRYKRDKGIALFLTMSVVFVVLTTVIIATAVILNNLDRAKEQASSAQASGAVNAGVEKIKALYKNNQSFFESCAVDDCINFSDPENTSCVSCSDVKATYTATGYRYKARIVSLTANGGTFAMSGYAGTAVSEQTVPVLFSTPVSRDAQRVAGANILIDAINQYYTVNGSYPEGRTCLGHLANYSLSDNGFSDTPSGTIYLASIPKPPLPQSCWRYRAHGLEEGDPTTLAFSLRYGMEHGPGKKSERNQEYESSDHSSPEAVRDSQRAAAINIVRQGLADFFSAHGFYPVDRHFFRDSTDVSLSDSGFSTKPTGTVYIESMPLLPDPANGYRYIAHPISDTNFASEATSYSIHYFFEAGGDCRGWRRHAANAASVNGSDHGQAWKDLHA